MRKLLIGLMVAIGLTATSGSASAWQFGHTGPRPATAAFPTANPPGWYTNTYWYPWYYPWFAYYSYADGPYANWGAGGGFAYYSTSGFGHPMYHGIRIPDAAALVSVNLPADAKLSFNGAVAEGTGTDRTFSTPILKGGVDYAYDLTAEIVKDGKVIAAEKRRVTVRAGQLTKVTLLAPPEKK